MTPAIDRPNVGIAVDGITNYGRAVLRGVMRYANVRRNWIIHEELRQVAGRNESWPECDGAIFAGLSADLIKSLQRRTRHFVVCSGAWDPALSPVVCLDDVMAGELAAGHLLDCHLENFGYFGPLGSATSNNRAKGFASALVTRGHACCNAPVYWPEEAERLRKSHWPDLIEWLRALPKPAGVLAYDDSAAHDLAAACLKADIAVPERIAIIGVNNDDLLCESAWPPLSSVDADFSRMGYVAAGLLDRLMRGEVLQPNERMIRLPPVGVVGRLSTDVLAVDDPNLADALKYIRDHACKPCTVEDVLRRVPVGRRWLERQFFARLGRTPHDEIMRIRLDRARQLMLNRDLTLAEISSHCGFSAVNNFSRAFTRKVGISPGKFRRSLR